MVSAVKSSPVASDDRDSPEQQKHRMQPQQLSTSSDELGVLLIGAAET